jgi:hypothetical protein
MWERVDYMMSFNWNFIQLISNRLNNFQLLPQHEQFILPNVKAILRDLVVELWSIRALTPFANL